MTVMQGESGEPMDENLTDVAGPEADDATVSPDMLEQAKAENGDETPISFRFSQRVVVLSDSNSPEAEAIAALRTHLLAHHVRAGRRGLAVCSPSSKSGATFVAVNLAVSLARAGIRTLLIDA